MLIRRAVRRFLCRNPVCPAITFAEQVAGLSGRYRWQASLILGELSDDALTAA